MCGICGIVEASPQTVPSRETLRAMNETQVHRGPDDEGYFLAPGIGLGMRRLSIIDIAGGAQPQANENETVWVVYNGEIYNYRQLKRELTSCGHCFRTQSDTEVIVHGYEEWGTRVVEHLRGMFAIALWDATRRRLLLARDRFGVKPLCYHLGNGRLVFASTARPVLAEGRVPARANLAALEALFEVGFVPSPLTMFEGIAQVPAAHRLIFEEGQLRLERYWDLDYARSEANALSHQDAVAQLRAGLEEAVDVRRMSEVPLGALLSGGIDSSSIAAILQRQSAEAIHTVSIGFEAQEYDEAPYAQTVAQHVGTRHHALSFRLADFDRLPQVVGHLEQPQCSATCLPIYLLYEKCREVGLTVVLTGEGADEMLGGYHWYRGDARAQALLGLPARLRGLLADSPLNVSHAARRVLRAGTREMMERYAVWQQVASLEERTQLLVSPSRDSSSAPAEWRNALAYGFESASPFHQMQYVESHTRLVDFINMEVDRLSMAHSIEARAPFLDHRLWEFCASLPTKMKMGGTAEKKLLREAMQDFLPRSTIQRTKQGLASPHSLWMKQKRLPDWAEERFSPAALAATNYFVPQQVACLRKEHVAGRRDNSRVLMGVLTTELWHRQFIS